MSEIDFTLIAGDVVRELLGPANEHLSTAKEWRYGSRGSLAIDLRKAAWHDHEQNAGGGLLDLICRETGCDRAGAMDWLRAHGYVAQDASPPRREGGSMKAKPSIVATYDYIDENGELLFQVCRMEPKDFRQRRPDTSQPGGWNWSTKGVRRVLYRLPDILTAPKGEPVFVVEGEKDADRLAEMGLIATTNAGGAGKWFDSYADALKGRDVIVLPDNDDAGRRHADQVEDSLRASGVRAVSIELTGLPPKGDVSDWIAAGGTAGQLRDMAGQRLAEAASDPAQPKSRADQIAGQLRPLSEIEINRGAGYLIKGWLDRLTLSVIYGESNVGKSFLALDMAIHVAASATNWHGHRVGKDVGAVVYVAAEGGRGIANRLAALRQEKPALAHAAGNRLLLLPEALDLCGDGDAEALIDALKAALGDTRPGLIVIDTLARSMGGGDENSGQDMGRLIRNADLIRVATGAHVLLVHHAGKDTAKGARGHSSLRAAVDTEIEIIREGENIVANTRKQRDMEGGKLLTYRLRGVRLGSDADGEDITSCIVEPVEGIEAAMVSLTPKMQMALDTFLEAKRAAGDGDDLSAGVHVENWRPVYYAKSTADTADSKKKAFQRARDDLVRARWLAVQEDVYRLTRAPQSSRNASFSGGTKRDKTGHVPAVPVGTGAGQTGFPPFRGEPLSRPGPAGPWGGNGRYPGDDEMSAEAHLVPEHYADYEDPFEAERWN